MSTNIRFQEWENDIELGVDWVQVWTTPTLKTAGRFHEAVWNLNSDYVDIKATVNGTVVLDVNLDILATSYGLNFNHNLVLGFAVLEYAPNKWLLRPPTPWQIDKDSGMTIEMRKSGNGANKNLVRGLSVWGEP
jgi:hypothetical protein